VLSVSELGAVGVAVVSPVAGTVASDPAAAPSLPGGESVAVDVSDDVAHVPDVVVAVAVSAPSVVLPEGATASAADVQEVSVAAVDVSAAASVLSAVVVVSVEDDDVSVDEIELAVSVAVASEGVSDALAVVSEVCALPVTSAVGVVVLASAETVAVSAEGTAVSVWFGGAGTSSALAGAIQVDVEAIPTINTAVQRISRASRRRRQSVGWNAATLRVPSFNSSLLAPTA
jgi:hypothetical protein